MNITWIRQQLAIAGKTQSDLGDAIGLTSVQVNKILMGGRQLKADEADKIRSFFGFVLPEDQPSTISVVGRVGAGDYISLSDDYEKGGGIYQIARPQWLPAHGVAAAEIVGASAEPWALTGDVIFWKREAMAVFQEDLGRPVVAETADGRVMLKRLASGQTPGKWSLLSLNPTHPNLIDVELKWAARVMPVLQREDVRYLEA